MPESPERRARREIDAKLTAAGWMVQDRDDLDLTAGRGIAVREFAMKPGHGSADYLLPASVHHADLRKLQEALTLPPVAVLWRAFTVAEASALADAAAKPQRGGDQLADLVTLLRHALKPELPLVPYADEVRQRYAAWRHDKAQARVPFTTHQSEWLDRMAEHIATSLSIEPDDFGMGWFGQHGSLGQAHALFGNQLQPLLAEINERLAA